MDELEEIRKQKLAAMQQNMQEQQEKQAEIEQQVEMLEAFVKQHMSAEAISRFGNIKLAHPEKAVQLLVVAGQLIKAGKIKEKISDEQLKQLLTMMDSEKKEFTIKRK